MLSVTHSSELADVVTCIITGTEWQYLLGAMNKSERPEVIALGEIIASVMNDSEPKEFEQDDWHVPYYHDGFWQPTDEGTDLHGNTLEYARDVSVGNIMAYMEYDGNPLKDGFLGVFEHQATVMGLRAVDIDEDFNFSFSEGVTHFDRKGKSWSANFVDWLQWRQMGSLYD